MDTNTTHTVTSTQRVRANQLVRKLRTNNQFEDARVLEAAIYWDSFPASYTATQVSLATALLTNEFGSENYDTIAAIILPFINTRIGDR